MVCINLVPRFSSGAGREPEESLGTRLGAHSIRKSLIYSTRKVFLKCAVVDLVCKFDEKSTASV